jgi:hypothetical protein
VSHYGRVGELESLEHDKCVLLQFIGGPLLIATKLGSRAIISKSLVEHYGTVHARSNYSYSLGARFNEIETEA